MRRFVNIGMIAVGDDIQSHRKAIIQLRDGVHRELDHTRKNVSAARNRRNGSLNVPYQAFERINGVPQPLRLRIPLSPPMTTTDYRIGADYFVKDPTTNNVTAVIGAVNPDYNTRKKVSFEVIVNEPGKLKWSVEPF